MRHLRRLPPEAWADLRCRYSYLSREFEVQATDGVCPATPNLLAAAGEGDLPEGHPALGVLAEWPLDMGVGPGGPSAAAGVSDTPARAIAAGGTGSAPSGAPGPAAATYVSPSAADPPPLPGLAAGLESSSTALVVAQAGGAASRGVNARRSFVSPDSANYVPSWPHVKCATCPNNETWRDCFQETVVLREASGQAGDEGEYRRTYRCAACMGQEWEISTREALFRIRDGRWDINKRRKQNAAFNQASATIAQNAPGLSRGERRNLCG